MTDVLSSFIYKLISEHLPAKVVEKIAEEAASNSIKVENETLYKYASEIADLVIPEELEEIELKEETQQDRIVSGFSALKKLVQSGQMSVEDAAAITQDIEEFDGRLPK